MNRDRWSVWFSYYVFILFGIGLGATGVLLPAQMRDYGVNQATIGATFVANSVGFVVASAVVGPLGHRFGMQRMIMVSSAVFGCAYLLAASRPPLVVLVLASFVTGAASGSCEGVLNAYVAGLPAPTAVMNRLHAFFGVGALLGPLATAGVLTVTDWPTVMLIMAGLALPPAAIGWLTFPDRAVDPLLVAHPDADVCDQAATADGSAAAAMSLSGRHALLAVVRQPLVLWAGAVLCVYVGLEQGIGNWGYTYLVDARSVSELLAGYTASGYWFGLTVGRFMATPATTRLRLSATQLLSVCMVGTAVSSGLLWAAPATAGLASLSFVPLGFFLGPVYPTIMSIMHRLTGARLVPTAIGALGAGGVAGGALFPWVMGTVIQLVGPWTLPPVALVLAALQYGLWRVLAHRLDRQGDTGAAVGGPNGEVGRFVASPAGE